MKKKRVKKPKSKVRKILEWVGTGLVAGLLVFCCVMIFTSKQAAKESGNPNAPVKIGNVYMPLIVQSESMDPVYKKGSAIFIIDVRVKDTADEFLNAKAQGKTTEIDLTFIDNYKAGVNIDNTYTEETKTILNEKKHVTVGGVEYQPERTTYMSPLRTTLTHRVFHVQVNDDIEYGKGKYYFFVEGINPSQQYKSFQNQYQVLTESELYGRVNGTSVFIGGIFSFATSVWGLITLLLIPTLYMVISSFVDIYKAAKEEEAEEEAEKNNPAINDKIPELSEEDKKRLKEELLEEMLKGKDK